MKRNIKMKQGGKSRGRRKFKGSKFTSDESVPDPYRAPRPYGCDWPVGHNYGNRTALLEFFLPVIKGTSEFPDVPFNSMQTIGMILKEKRMLSGDPSLAKELDHYELCDKADITRHPSLNCPELPLELLHKALSLCPEYVLQHYDVVQRALGRLYAVAWWGHGPDSAEAKKQLEKLVPTGNAHPITKHIPELAKKLREIRRWIRNSNELMKQKFPREADRVRNLAELYDERTDVIWTALRQAETAFLANRLAEILVIPIETARKELQKRHLG